MKKRQTIKQNAASAGSISQITSQSSEKNNQGIKTESKQRETKRS